MSSSSSLGDEIAALCDNYFKRKVEWETTLDKKKAKLETVGEEFDTSQRSYSAFIYAANHTHTRNQAIEKAISESIYFEDFKNKLVTLSSKFRLPHFARYIHCDSESLFTRSTILHSVAKRLFNKKKGEEIPAKDVDAWLQYIKDLQFNENEIPKDPDGAYDVETIHLLLKTKLWPMDAKVRMPRGIGAYPEFKRIRKVPIRHFFVMTKDVESPAQLKKRGIVLPDESHQYVGVKLDAKGVAAILASPPPPKAEGESSNEESDDGEE
jgi:hypothetical protein